MRGPARRVLRSVGPLGAPLGSMVSIRTVEPHVVLTFDDGPRPGSTEAVVDALGARGATATFFVLAGRVRRSPTLAAAVAAAGHEIALHGLDHRAFPTFPPTVLARRTADAKAIVEDAVQRPVRWSRPPYGRQDLASWRVQRAAGLRPVLWNATLWDSRDISDAERLTKAVNGVGHGAIVLAHDSFADASDGAADGAEPDIARGRLIAALLERYADAGLTAASLETALRTGPPVLRARFSA